MISDGTRFGLIVAGGLALTVLAGSAAWLAIRHADSIALADSRPAAVPKTYRQTLAKNLRVVRSEMACVDFVKCGTCRLEKRKRGPITLGALNMLVLEDLSVVLPDDETPEGGGGERDDTMGVVRHLGVNDGFLSSRGIPYRFSGVRIQRLAVSRFVREKGVQPVFRAEQAEAVRGGLELSHCEVAMVSGEMSSIGKAMLTKKGHRLHLAWRGGEMEI